MKIRNLTEADYPAVQALHRHVGWPARSLAGWRWLHDNPARHEIGSAAGWVADDEDGEPAAHVGNMIQRFNLGDQVLYGATGFSIIVSRTVRGVSHQMLKAFNAQPNVFAAYTFNANAKSQPLYARYGMKPWPEATHALKLSWPVDRAVLATGRVLRELVRVFPGVVPHLGEQLMNDRLGLTPRLALPPGVAVLTDFRDKSRFAEFWQALRSEGRLLSDRSPAALRWRMSDPDLTTPPLVLAFNRGRDITGYAMAMMAKSNIVEAPVLEIIDLEAVADDAQAIPTLMKALIGAARPLGAAKVRLQTTAPHGLARLGEYARSARTEGGWGHCHVRFNPGAPDPALWSPTPYDADHAICLRPLPIGEGARVRAPAGATATASKA